MCLPRKSFSVTRLPFWSVMVKGPPTSATPLPPGPERDGDPSVRAPYEGKIRSLYEDCRARQAGLAALVEAEKLHLHLIAFLHHVEMRVEGRGLIGFCKTNMQMFSKRRKVSR